LLSVSNGDLTSFINTVTIMGPLNIQIQQQRWVSNNSVWYIVMCIPHSFHCQQMSDYPDYAVTNPAVVSLTS